MAEKANPVVIVTGSSGLIGEAIVRRLAPRYEVVGLDVVSPPTDSPVDFVKFDLTKDESVKTALDYVVARYGNRIASVIHLAAYYDFSGEPSPLYEEITVKGTERLLHALQQHVVEQFVFSSTLLVHEPTEPGRPISEDHPLHPKWDYPESKVKTEQKIREQHGDVPYVILRIAGIYDDKGHSIPISNQIKRIYEKDLTGRVYPGDLTHGQAYLHLEDLVNGLEKCVEMRADIQNEVFLMAEPDTCSYIEMQEIIGREIHGQEWDTIEIPKPMARLGAWVQDKVPLGEEPFIKAWMVDLADDHYEVDIRKAQEQLGWTSRHRLADTLPKIVDYLKKDPLKWYEDNDLQPPEELEEAAEHR